MQNVTKQLAKEQAMVHITRAVVEARQGISARPVLMIVYCMACNPGERFADALQAWSEYETIGGDPDRRRPAGDWFREICCVLLTAEVQCHEGVAAWFHAMAKEVRTIADRIFA